MKYYIHKDGKQQGPYSIQELENISIDRNTMVWQEGMNDWEQAQKVGELKELFKAVPPPLKSAKPPPLKEKESPVLKNEKPKSRILVTIGKVIFLLIIIGIGIVAVAEMNKNSRIQERVRVESAVNNVIEKKEDDKKKAKYRNSLGRYLIPTTNNYKKNLAFGGIWDLEIKLKNNTPYTMNKVAVKLFYVKANGDTYQTRRLFFNNVKPNQQIVLNAPNSDKGVEVRCRIDGLNSLDLNLHGLSM